MIKKTKEKERNGDKLRVFVLEKYTAAMRSNQLRFGLTFQATSN